MSSNLFMWQLC